LIGEQINKSDNVTTEQLRFNPGYRAPYQCGSEGACRNCDEDNPCLCCDNNYCGSSDPNWHDLCDGNCVWWAWDRACCLWGVGLDFHPGGGEWAEAAQDYGYRVRPPDVSGGYYDAGWVIVNPNTDEYQVAEAWVDEKVMYSALYISAQPVLAYPSIFRNGIWCVDTTGNREADRVFGYGIPGDVPLVGNIG
jgi:hypothetical protein